MHRLVIAASVAAALVACSGSSPVSPVGDAPASAANEQLRANVLAAQGRRLPSGSHVRSGIGYQPQASVPIGSHLIYSGNFFANTITIYPMTGINPAPIGTISTGLANPERLFVDAHLRLYASNGTDNSVVVYRPGKTAPSLTISHGVSTPTGLAVGVDGTLYCANVGNATVTEYPKGSTSPALTISLSNETPENLAVGPGGNLYIQYIGGPLGSGVIEVPHAQTTGQDLNLTIGNAGAVAVDRAGNVIVLDTNVPAVDVFPPGQSTPSKTLRLHGVPFELALNKPEGELYVSSEFGSSFSIQTIGYPGLPKAVTKITSSVGDWPLAIAPDAVQ